MFLPLSPHPGGTKRAGQDFLEDSFQEPNLYQNKSSTYVRKKLNSWLLLVINLKMFYMFIA